MRLEPPARIEAALRARLAHAAITPPVQQLAAPRSRIGFWKSFGAWAGIGLFSGLLNVGLKAALATGMRTAFDPLLWKVNNTTQESLGARFNDSWSNPVKALVARFIAPPKKTSETAPEIFDAPLAAECVATFVRRSSADDRVLGQVDSFYTGTLRMMQMVCEGVRDRLAADDLHGAARRLAGAIVHDRLLRYELSPKAERLYEVLYAKLRPYFRGLERGGREALVAEVVHEVARLSTDASRAGALAHAELMMRGLTDTTPERPLELVVATPVHIDAASQANRDLLATLYSAESDNASASQAYVTRIFETSLNGRSPVAKVAAHRARRRITRAVTRELAAFETKIGRAATLGELWSLVATAIASDASATVESRATSASVGAFVAVGAAAAIPKAAMGKLDDSVRAALDPVVFTIVGFFMGAAGKFWKERLDAYGRRISYSSPAKVSLGAAIERDLLDVFLRVLANDGRLPAARNALMQLGRFLHTACIDAEESYRRGDLVGAAQFLSGTMQYLAVTHAEFSSRSKSFDIIAAKLGPHFDGLSAGEVQRLRVLVLDDLTAAGVSEEVVARYHLPLITALLTRNVEAIGTTGPGAAACR